MCKYLQQH